MRLNKIHYLITEKIEMISLNIMISQEIQLKKIKFSKISIMIFKVITDFLKSIFEFKFDNNNYL